VPQRSVAAAASGRLLELAARPRRAGGRVRICPRRQREAHPVRAPPSGSAAGLGGRGATGNAGRRRHVLNMTRIGPPAILIRALSCGPALAWAHSGAYGSASGGGGSWSASSNRGGSASGGGGSWSGSGYRGGSASGGGGSWSGSGAYGGTASHSEGETTASRYGTTATHETGSGQTNFSNQYGGTATPTPRVGTTPSHPYRDTAPPHPGA